ncbi:hypothetical protein DIURU_000363 [Diutina rugosa]|uniref:Uncharacterized protein n=1 Tax=Diutina rugosa TaxID=5481 RepID=A0A642V3R8_DIURU|nr:uncharacterized protein DIURU_000363 [Diutina rugosa]KAA8907953.1 hypothetical protein DIURU_000363 [Diutina rugosa]
MELLVNLPILKTVAYQVDVIGQFETFNCHLKQIVAELLPTTASTISIELNAPAQSNVAKLTPALIAEVTAAFVNEIGGFIYEADTIENVRRVQQIIKKLYQSVDYLDPVVTATIVRDIFPHTNSYGEDLRDIIDSLKSDMITTNRLPEITRGLVRGLLMLLLNLLPTLIFTNNDDIAAWKSQHLSDLLDPPMGPQPSASTQAYSGYIATEWQHYKSNSKSRLESPDFLKEISKMSSTASTDTNLQGTSAHTDKVQTTSNSHSQIISDHITHGIAAFTKTFAGYTRVHPDKFPPMILNTSAAMLRYNFEKLLQLPLEDPGALKEEMIVVVTLVLGAVSTKASLTVPDWDRMYLFTMTMFAVLSTLGKIIFEVIKSKGPVAFVASDDIPAIVISRSVISKFKKKEPYMADVPWGQIQVEGTGILKVVDIGGKSFGIKALYSPKSAGNPCLIHDSSNRVHEVRMSEAIPAIVPSSDLQKNAKLLHNEDDPYDVRKHGEGNVYTMRARGDVYIPLRQSPKVASLIEGWTWTETGIVKCVSDTREQRWGTVYVDANSMPESYRKYHLNNSIRYSS